MNTNNEVLNTIEKYVDNYIAEMGEKYKDNQAIIDKI